MQDPATLDSLSNGVAAEPAINRTAPAKENKVVYIDEANAWIRNDGLLRDEGVLFGWNGTSKSEKLDAIRSYYQQLIAPEQVTAKNVQDEAAALREQIYKTTEQRAPEQAVRSTSTLPGYVISLIVLVAAAGGCFFIIDASVYPVYGRWAAVGVYLFGSFAQLAPVSHLLGGNEVGSHQFGFREGLLELGPPIASTLLTAYLQYSAHGDLLLSLAVGLFLLFLFLLNGKLLLAITQMLTRDIHAIINHADARNAAKNENQDFSKLQERLAELRRVGSESEVRVAALTEEMNNKICLFESEYTLAYEFAQTFNKK